MSEFKSSLGVGHNEPDAKHSGFLNNGSVDYWNFIMLDVEVSCDTIRTTTNNVLNWRLVQ